MNLGQLCLLRRVIAVRRPDLAPLVDRLVRGETISEAEAAAIRNVVFVELVECELAEGGLTPRGEELDRVVRALRDAVVWSDA